MLLAIDKENWQRARTSLRALLDAADERFLPVGTVSYACLQLISQTEKPSADKLLLEATQALERFAHYGLVSGEPLRFAASNAGTLMLKLHGTEDARITARAHDLLLLALEAEDEPPATELSAWLATTSWRLGESHQEAGDETASLDLLLDAKDHFLAVLESADDGTAIDMAVVHSRLAVLLLRIQAVTGDLTDASLAIKHMKAAIELGGKLSPRLGHLGDAYYRIGRVTRDCDCLREAIRYKRAARVGPEGDQSRENRSVAAAILLILWQCTADDQYLLEAVEEVANAVQSDTRWPWPFFQLSDILALLEQSLAGETAKGVLSREADSLLDSVNWSATEAQLKGCELSVRSNEFARVSLGGRRQSAVHVLSDPHGLLRQAVVFKMNRWKLATREPAAISRLETFLESLDAPACFRCPSPMGCVADAQGNEWYATSYERGMDLGRLIAQSQSPGTATRDRSYAAIGKAIHFLALFHACFGIADRNQPGYQADAERFWQADVGDQLRILADPSDKVAEEFRKLVVPGLPLCRKKDAHPENWIVTHSGDIVMIDLELTQFRGHRKT